ncbi:gp09-like protein [Phenacoccus solenopsis nudivirus]|nr:gp09-like protein [Phenacoccus solenopsis nudivirus]
MPAASESLRVKRHAASQIEHVAAETTTNCSKKFRQLPPPTPLLTSDTSLSLDIDIYAAVSDDDDNDANNNNNNINTRQQIFDDKEHTVKRIDYADNVNEYNNNKNSNDNTEKDGGKTKKLAKESLGVGNDDCYRSNSVTTLADVKCDLLISKQDASTRNVSIEGFTFCFARGSVYLTRFPTWNLFSNFNVKPYLQHVPFDVRDKLEKHWRHVIHVEENSRAAFGRLSLKQRVLGGQILAYYYTELSIMNYPCIYYGYLPSYNQRKQTPQQQLMLDDERYYTTDRLYVSAQKIWPCTLFAYLERVGVCECSKRCVLVKLLTRQKISPITTHSVAEYNYCLENRSFDDVLKMEKRSADIESVGVCIKRLRWDDVYLMMGKEKEDMDENAFEREIRVCNICAQCRKCANSATYCRTHRKCTHKKVPYDRELNIQNVMKLKSAKRIQEQKI